MMRGTLKLRNLPLLLVALLVGCSKPPAALVDLLPGAEAIPGWKPARDAETFNPENLYDFVDGQADAYFAYGFEDVAVGSYENASGDALWVAIWQVATPADAYGLFTGFRTGAPVAIGNGGDADAGRRLDFWQSRYFVRVFARQPVPEADLRAFGDAVAAALPAGGEPPALMGRLPQDNQVEHSAIFFRQEISIQSWVWLGGENLLGLGPEAEGALARYTFGAGEAQLLLIAYPKPEEASAALAVLESGQVEGLVAAQAGQAMLGAVFGQVSAEEAGSLLTAAFKSP